MDVKSSTLVHRLLFHALTEMRDQGRSTGDKLVYQLSDLFHNAALQMEAAERDDPAITYDEILQHLKEQAQQRGIDKWLDERIEQIESRVHASSSAT